jgi:hypothetical protein
LYSITGGRPIVEENTIPNISSYIQIMTHRTTKQKADKTRLDNMDYFCILAKS